MNLSIPFNSILKRRKKKRKKKLYHIQFHYLPFFNDLSIPFNSILKKKKKIPNMVLLRSTKINGPMIGLDYVFHLVVDHIYDEVVDHIYDEVFSEDLQTQLIKSIFPQSFFFFFF